MKEIIVILDNIRSALNVGAIFRTCEGAGVSRIILGGITPYPPHPKIKKTALGADEFVPFEHKQNLLKQIEALKEDGFEIISIEESKESTSFFEYEFSDKIAFVFGHEITGVSMEVQDLSDSILELPMMGQKRSLNVATVAGITIYNARFSK